MSEVQQPVEQTIDPQTTEVPAADPVQAQVESSMSAGFNKVRGIKDETAAAAPVAAVVEEPAPPAEKPALTDDELRAMVAKMPELDAFRGQTATEMQKMHGKIGEFNRTLQALQQAPTATNSAAAQAARKKLTEEYPELADSILPLLEGRSGVSQEHVGTLVKDQVGASMAEIRQETAEFLLTQTHPDWRSVRTTDAYKAWLPTLPEAQRAEFLSTWDPGLVSTKLSEFKKWRDDSFTKTREKQTRLTQAIPPTGVPGRAGQKLPDSAGLSVGFNRVRKGLSRATM